MAIANPANSKYDAAVKGASCATTEMYRIQENLKNHRPMFYELDTVNKDALVKVLKPNSRHFEQQGSVIAFDPTSKATLVEFEGQKFMDKEKESFQIAELSPITTLFPNRVEPDN